MRKIHLIVLIILVLLTIVLYINNNETRNHFNITCEKTYGLSFPPFSNPDQIDFTLNQLETFNIDRIRIAIDWKNREPEKGEYYWAPMDYRMKKAKEKNISVFLTVPSNGPEWACSNIKNDKTCVFNGEESFSEFLTEILSRYQIDKIQFGNEWETTYAGTMQEFVRFNNLFYDLVKETSPETDVVLGGITRAYPMVEFYCNQGNDFDFSDIEFDNGYSKEKIILKVETDYCDSDYKEKVLYVFENAKYDMIDIHLYDDPLNWESYVDNLPKEKPIIVTEFGGPSSVFEKTNQKYQAERMQEYLRVIETLPIEEAYYFKLTDSADAYHKNSGLFDDKLNKKKSYNVFSKCVIDTSK
ncbi:beta-galactosidase [archaeon]|nr:beta-galactosidase [archaeon]